MDLSNEINGKNIYLQNGFRIFNLPINAKPNKINNEFSRIEAMKNLNSLDNTESLDVYNNLAFPIEPKPNFLDYQNAKNRLSKPRSRFIDELFWFWPEDLGNKRDETIMALKKVDIDGAVSLWNSSTAANASHNLAVYNHIMAIDAEIRGDLSSSQSYWRESLKQWHKTLSNDNFKNLTLLRVQQLNDPTIKQDYVEDIFRQFPVAILSINASFANDYYEKHENSNFGKHIELIRNSDFDELTKKQALKGIFDSLYDSVNEKFEAFEKYEYEKQSDIPKIESFLASIKDEIAILQQYFGDDAQFQLLSDNIAKSVKGYYVSIVNRADSFDGFDLDKIKQVFKGLVEMAYTISVKQEIENNLEQLEEVMRSVKSSAQDDAIHKRITSFIENVENRSLPYVKTYSEDMQRELDNSDSPNNEVLSDGFALSLDNFVITYVNQSESDIDRVIRNKATLMGFLRTAQIYATSDEVREKVKKDMEFFTEQLPEIEKQKQIIKQLQDSGVDLSSLGSSSSSSSSSGGGKGGAIGCIIIIIIIFAIIAYFLGFI